MPKTNKKETEFIEIYQANEEPEAYVIKGLLESNDIPCFFKSPTSPSANIFAFSRLSTIKIMVKAEDADEARKLVEGDKNA